MEFTTPAVPNPPPTSKFGSFQAIQDPGNIAPRNGALSATPCDFTVGITGQSGIYVQLQPNTTYYVNMYNPSGCGGMPTCDVRVQFAEQPGT